MSARPGVDRSPLTRITHFLILMRQAGARRLAAAAAMANQVSGAAGRTSCRRWASHRVLRACTAAVAKSTWGVERTASCRLHSRVILREMAVDDTHRGSGLGSALLQSAVETTCRNPTIGIACLIVHARTKTLGTSTCTSTSNHRPPTLHLILRLADADRMNPALPVPQMSYGDAIDPQRSGASDPNAAAAIAAAMAKSRIEVVSSKAS